MGNVFLIYLCSNGSMSDDEIIPNMQEVIIARGDGAHEIYSSGNTRDPMIESTLPRAMYVQNSTIVGDCLTERGHSLSRTREDRMQSAVSDTGITMDVGAGTLRTNATIAQIRQCAVDNNISATAWDTDPVEARSPRAMLRDVPLATPGRRF